MEKQLCKTMTTTQDYYKIYDLLYPEVDDFIYQLIPRFVLIFLVGSAMFYLVFDLIRRRRNRVNIAVLLLIYMSLSNTALTASILEKYKQQLHFCDSCQIILASYTCSENNNLLAVNYQYSLLAGDDSLLTYQSFETETVYLEPYIDYIVDPKSMLLGNITCLCSYENDEVYLWGRDYSTILRISHYTFSLFFNSLLTISLLVVAFMRDF